MSESILSGIIDAEQQAARIEEESKRQVREIIADARKESARIIEKSVSDIESVRAEILEKASREAQDEIERHKDSVDRDADDLRRSAQQRMDTAVQFILGRIVDLSGSR